MKFIILGCGSSMGVPRSDGYFGRCDPKNKKNYRTRCSALLKTKNEVTLIDTSPDLRQQLLNNKIRKIDRVLYSHMHADQTHGINDLRVFFIQNQKPIPVYADVPTSKFLMESFKYCFINNNTEYPATLKLRKNKKKFFIANGTKKICIDTITVTNNGKTRKISKTSLDNIRSYLLYVGDEPQENNIDISNVEIS